MSNPHHSKRRKQRRGHWWRSWLNRLPHRLVSREFNIYQAVLVALVGYLAFRILMAMGVGTGVDSPPE
jgi:hypothetical protein